MALGMNLCVHVPASENSGDSSSSPSERLSAAALLSPVTDWSLQTAAAPPTPGSNGLKLSKSLSRSSKVCFLGFFFLFFSFLSTFE